MTTVLLLGSDKGSETTDILFSAFRAVQAPAVYLTAKTLSMNPPDARRAEFLVLDNSSIRHFQVNSGIVVFRSIIEDELDCSIPKGFVAVTESDNGKAIAYLQKNLIQTVTCGLSQRDTLTYSSLEPDKAVVGLQREIRNLDGESVLPHEVPVKLQAPLLEYPLLAAAAVLFISGIEIAKEGFTL